MKKLLMILLILCINIIPIMAEEGIEISIINNTINVRGYTMTTLAGKVSAGFFSPLNETISNSSIICDNITVNTLTNGNYSNQTFQNNCRLLQSYNKNIVLSVNSSYTTIIGDTQLQKNYEECLVSKAQFSAGLDSCVKERDKREDASENYTRCSTDLQICNSDKNKAIEEKTKADATQKENENQKYVWSVIALVAGILGTLYFKGHIGGAKVNSSEQQFNQMQAA